MVQFPRCGRILMHFYFTSTTNLVFPPKADAACQEVCEWKCTNNLRCDDNGGCVLRRKRDAAEEAESAVPLPTSLRELVHHHRVKRGTG